jgi:hypothetical protein
MYPFRQNPRSSSGLTWLEGVEKLVFVYRSRLRINWPIIIDALARKGGSNSK